MTRHIALIISYDGTDYAGWQIQENHPSIQGAIEEAISDLHDAPTVLTGASRTDAGVHAHGQVGTFFTEKDSISDWQFRNALNARLPRSIRVIKSCQVDEIFHARRTALGRFYEYRLVEGYVCPPPFVRFAWQIPRLPSISLLNDMALALYGCHDFTTFTVARDSSPNRIREIYHAVFLSDGPYTIFRVGGNAFLWRMVRSLLGTMIDTALRGGDDKTIRSILNSRNRKAAGPTAPARGLFLSKVEYEPKWGIF